MTLVYAIQAYEKDHGEPPQKLELLVHKYLSAVPRTGLGMYPEYFYWLGTVENKYPWIIKVDASRGYLNWDTFIYLPGEQYTEKNFGANADPIGRWGYVHE